MFDVDPAEVIARKAHAGQLEESTGDPYIRHVERVVALVDGEDAETVAWLHDVIEDTAVTFAELEDAGLAPRILKAVALLTHHAPTTYAAYIQTIKDSGDELAIAVKIADLLDHLRPNCPPRLRARYEAAWLTFTGQQWVSWAGRQSTYKRDPLVTGRGEEYDRLINSPVALNEDQIRRLIGLGGSAAPAPKPTD